MAKLSFVQLDVFTTTRYAGNPLAIVQIPSSLSDSITQSEKQRIASEFNLSETVFLHTPDASSAADAPVRMDIFTTTEELPFAGHPTVGTGSYLLSQRQSNKITLRTKAGDIPVVKTSNGVKLRVPVDFKIHAPIAHPLIKAQQPGLSDADYVHGSSGAEGLASIVKGMTFVLVEVKSTDALGRMQAYGARVGVEGLDDKDGVVKLRTRMFDGTLEDPATGSAASTLAGWLSVQRGAGKWRFEIEQGVEMGRRSEIFVEVGVGEGDVMIELGGSAVEVMEGSLLT
ncbi:hypothetical protein H0H92_003030 [Tricholoma furcatifolium]|nr:hypothetical protein H0H92_003030 [Tricholoma furcatifolium]